MKILFVHRAFSGLGDSIRIEKILWFLKKHGFSVQEARLPSLTLAKVHGVEGMKEILPSLLPLHLPNKSSLKPLMYINLSLATNSLDKIVKRESFDAILAGTSLIGWVALRVAEETSIPCVIDVHGLAGVELKGVGDKYWYLAESLEREAFRKCDHLLVVSDSMKKFITSRYNIDSSKVTVVYNGADVLSSSAEYDFPLKVIYAGGFKYWENVESYLEVAKSADRRSFEFYLAGPPARQVLSQIKVGGIPIKYLGYLPRDKVLKLMAKMQIGIAPSTRDLARITAFPIKVLDYMSCGLPVITPRVGEWGDLVKKEDCGVALESDDIEEYLKALGFLSKRDVWLRKSANALRIIKTEFGWDKVLLPLKNVLILLA